MWDDLYNYLDKWYSNISLEYDESNIYVISSVMDKMMDLEADDERGEK